MISDRSTCPIVTFYSYKGGTGRTMALANVGWLLAANGHRVLMIDWDLEAPGLHRYFHPFLDDPDLVSSTGLVDWVADVFAASQPLEDHLDQPSISVPLKGPTTRGHVHEAPDPPSAILTLESHTGSVLGVAWSPDGTRLATASRDRTVRVWDPVSGDQSMVLEGHTGAVWRVAWSPDGTRLAATSDDHSVRVWDPVTGDQLIVLEGHTGPVWGLVWSPDGTRLATASRDRTVRVWDPVTGDQLITLKGHTGPVVGVAWSPDGARLATTGGDHSVRVWDPVAGDQVMALKGHTDWVWGVAWSPDGAWLATTGGDHSVRVWDPVAGDQVMALKGHTGSVWGVAWSPDGSWLATASDDRSARVWDPVAGDEVATLKGHTNWVRGVAWSPDGTRLATASADQTVRVWEGVTGSANKTAGSGFVAEQTATWWEPLASLIPHTQVVDYSFPEDGLLHLVPAGRQDAGYAVKVDGIDWHRFYEIGGGVLLETLKDEWCADYDIVLVDSRTGLADTAGICTVQLPDELVVCFTLNQQSIDGAAAVTESVCQQRIGDSGERTITVWPLPCRIELAEFERLEAAREEAQVTFAPYLSHLTPNGTTGLLGHGRGSLPGVFRLRGDPGRDCGARLAQLVDPLSVPRSRGSPHRSTDRAPRAPEGRA